MTHKSQILCGHIPSKNTYSIWFWDKAAKTYWPEMPFENAIEDLRFQTYVANAVRKPPTKRDRSEEIAIAIAMKS